MNTPTTPGRALDERLAQAVDWVRDGDLSRADAAFDELLREAPDHPDCLHFAGVLRHLQGRSAEGASMIRQALERVPGNGGMWKNLGNVLHQSGDEDGAVAAYERSLALAGDGAAPDVLNNIGVVEQRRGRVDAAETALRRAVALDPDYADAWYNLSRLLVDTGRIHDGLQANAKAVLAAPQDAGAREQVLRSLILLGERERAAVLIREWLQENPDQPVALHMLAAVEGDEPPERASDAYTEQVFDSFAATFDAKLTSLNYRAPQAMAEALREACGAPAGALDIVDAGCGTGLVGMGVRPWARRLAGCDLSVGMLQRARARGVYDVLHKAELVYYLDTQPAAFDVVTCADTLVYFGPLEAVAAAAHRTLRPSGWLLFSVEALPEDDPRDHRINPSGRYAHAGRYVRRVLEAAGFEDVAVEPFDSRMESGLPVASWLVRGRRSADGSAAGG